jgi:hypothetical protein
MNLLIQVLNAFFKPVIVFDPNLHIALRTPGKVVALKLQMSVEILTQNGRLAALRARQRLHWACLAVLLHL